MANAPWNEQQEQINYLERGDYDYESDPEFNQPYPDEDYDPETYDFKSEELRQIRYLFNVDRWAAYTKQRLHNQGLFVKSVMSYHGSWADTTPKQRRRMLKKMRKRRDYSVGVHAKPNHSAYSVNYYDTSQKRELTQYFAGKKKAKAFIDKCDNSKGRYEVIEWYGFLYDANAPF